MKQINARPLSLRPLSFREAVTDLLKVKPEPKHRKPKAQGKGKGRKKVASGAKPRK